MTAPAAAPWMPDDRPICPLCHGRHKPRPVVNLGVERAAEPFWRHEVLTVADARAALLDKLALYCKGVEATVTLEGRELARFRSRGHAGAPVEITRPAEPTPRRRAARASYREAVAWIAGNDEPTLMSPAEIVDLISVQLVADLWAKDAEEVAADVVRYRARQAKEAGTAYATEGR